MITIDTTIEERLELNNIDNSEYLNWIENHILDNKKTIEIKPNMNVEEYLTTYENIVKILLFLSELTQPIFQKHDELEEYYKIKYYNSPSIGNLKYLKHVKQLHRTYDLYKNRCFTLLELLDENYKKYHNNKLPNTIRNY